MKRISHDALVKVSSAKPAGYLDEVLSLIPDLEDFAREHGCKAIRMQGRKGWARVLPSYGWKEDKQVIFERAL